MARTKSANARKTLTLKRNYINVIKQPKIRINYGTMQVVMSEPTKIFKERYLTAKGKRLLANKEISKNEAWEKYGKNRYVNNVNAVPVRIILHQVR